MPVIKSAIKKMRQDKKRESENNSLRVKIDQAIRVAKKSKTAASVSAAVSLVDKGVKKKIVPANRAARIKSGLSKLSKPGTKAKTSTPEAKKTVKKPAARKTSKTSKKAAKK